MIIVYKKTLKSYNKVYREVCGMAIYVYKCKKCGCTEEKRHGMSEKPVFLCEKCGLEMKKDIGLSTKPVFGFNGWGFYDTDYKQKKG